MIKRIKKTSESKVVEKEPVQKIKSIWPRKIGRAMFWLMIGFLTLRGIGTLFYSDDSTDVTKLIENTKSAGIERFETEMQAAAFAENFIGEYLTYSSLDRNEHNERISKYYLDSLDDYGMNNIQGQAVVQDATALSVKWYSAEQLNIDVKAKLKYTIKTPAAEPDKPMVEQEKCRDVYIRVPVRKDNGKYVVEDIPIFIPEPEKASVKYEPYSGETVEDTGNIREMLSNFIKTYFEGSESEILYYLSDPANRIAGMKGAFSYKSLDNLRVFRGPTENEYLAMVEFTIVDPISNQALKQRMHVVMEKKETRYYIRQFDARTGNLNNREED
ncbi:MAG: conjugal transfer protein [Caulobacteraceae bacterium]